MTMRKKVAFALVAAVMAIWLGIWLKRQLDIDTCLDHGGRWIYEIDKCEGRTE